MKDLGQLLVDGINNNPTAENIVQRIISMMAHYPDNGYCQFNDLGELPESIITFFREIGFEAYMRDINYGSFVKWPKPSKEDKRRSYVTYPDYSNIYDPSVIEAKMTNTINMALALHPNSDVYIIAMMPKKLIDQIAYRISRVFDLDICVEKDNGILTVYKCLDDEDEEEETKNEVEEKDSLQDHIALVPTNVSVAKPPYTAYRDYRNIKNPRMAALKVAYQLELVDKSNPKFKVTCKLDPRCLDTVKTYIVGLYGGEYVIEAIEDGTISIYNHMDAKTFHQEVLKKEAENKEKADSKELFTTYSDWRDITDIDTLKMKLISRVTNHIDKLDTMHFEMRCMMPKEYVKEVAGYISDNVPENIIVHSNETDGIVAVYDKMEPPVKKEEPKKASDPMDKLPVTVPIVDAKEAYTLSTSALWYVADKVHKAIVGRQTSTTIPGCFMTARVKEVLEENHYKLEKHYKGLAKGGSYSVYEISWHIDDIEWNENNDLDDDDEEE